MCQKIIKSISENLLIPVSGSKLPLIATFVAVSSYALFELVKNYKSIKNYMNHNITLNKSPFK
jgi:hypothetical protein